MTFRDYQELARRTQNHALWDKERLRHALFGLASEAGEILGIYQKELQGHMVSRDKVIDELGDLLWFCSELADSLEVTLDDVAMHNVAKLRERYPRGFESCRSINRKESAI